ncbi:glycosyltransferase family 4 protein [Candidatus Omnitrophota bacterium]
MKKILIFNSGSFLYGSERGLVNVVKALSEQYDITVVLPQGGPLTALLRKLGAEVKLFPLSVLALSFSPFYYIWYVLLTIINVVYFSAYAFWHKVDIVYSNNSLLIFPCFVARLSGKKHVWHLREFFHNLRVNKIIAALALKFSSKIICQSNNIKSAYFPKDRNNIKVIYEGLDFDDYKKAPGDLRKELGISQEATVLGIVSRIHPHKGQCEFVELAAPLLKTTRENTVLLIAGDISPATYRNRAYKNRLEKLIKENDLEDKVHFLGFREDIKSIFSITDIAIFPFMRNEPFGLALLEGIAFSGKVLFNPNPGSDEIASFFKGNCGLLGSEELKAAIEKKSIKKMKPDFPNIFLFKSYKENMLSFMREV